MSVIFLKAVCVKYNLMVQKIANLQQKEVLKTRVVIVQLGNKVKSLTFQGVFRFLLLQTQPKISFYMQTFPKSLCAVKGSSEL